MAPDLIARLRQRAADDDRRLALTAIAGTSSSLSYAALGTCVDTLARQLEAATAPGEVILVMCHRGATQALLLLACLQARRAAALIDLRQGPHRVAAILRQCPTASACADEQGLRLLDRLREVQDTPLPRLLWRATATDDGAVLSAMPLDGADESALVSLPPHLAEAAVILFTSGSTGTPKGVCISRSDLERRIRTEERWFELTSADVTVGVLPLSFDVGLTQLLGTLFTGGHHVLLNSWLPADVLKGIQTFEASGLALSPMVWKSLLGGRDSHRLWSTLNTLRYVSLSGGTLPRDQLQVIHDHLADVTLIKTYGQTEMFRIASLKYAGDATLLESVGQPYPGVTLEIVDSNGRPCSPDTVGQIVAHGDGKMLGYLDRDNPSASISPMETGDLGYRDRAGNLFVVGRQNEMIKILDQRVFPDDVANSLREILGLPELWVVAVDMDVDNPRLVAAALREHLAQPAAEAIRRLRQLMPSHLVPAELMLLDKFPVTSSGKIDKQALRELAAAALLHADTARQASPDRVLATGS